MKRNFLAVFALLVALIAVLPKGEISHAAESAKAECVLEVSSRRVLHEENAETNLPMASTTKVLTAILIIDSCNLDEEVAVPKEAEGTEGSSVYLRAGDVLTVRDLLYGLMLRSGNDCAVTLALYHSGSIEAFAHAMNKKAAALGVIHSKFVNPHGLPDKRHYTTARDLALISAYAMENETFREIVSCKFYAPRGWQNKNRMLYEYDGAIGVKTGFTLAAGRCLVTCAERGGMTIVTVVLSCPDMYGRTKELLDNAFQNYSMVKLCERGKPVEGMVALSDFSYPLTEEEEGKIVIQIERLGESGSEEEEIAGRMRIFLEKDLIFSQNLVMIEP